MRTLKFIVDKQLILKDPDCDFSGLVPGTDEWLKAEFSFSAEWDGFAKTILFWSPLGIPYPERALYDDGVRLIPEEATKMRIFKISVKGTKGEATLTTNKIAIIQDDDIPEVSKDDTVVSSLIARVSKLDSKVEDQVKGLSTETDRATKAEAGLQDNITTLDNKIGTLNEEVDGKQPAGDYALKNDITVKDVQVAGASVVADGVADVPIAQTWVVGKKRFGVMAPSIVHGLYANDGLIQVYPAEKANIDNRTSARPIVPTNLDYAVKAALMDGKGPAWTAAQQAARERMGIDKEYELIEEITLTESAMEISRNAEPDGTAYAFDAVAIKMNRTNTGVGGVYVCNGSTTLGWSYIAQSGRYFGCETFTSRGYWQNYRYSASAGSNDYNSISPAGHTRFLTIKKVTGAHIDRILIASSSDGFDTGTTIQIYGVRA